MVSDEHCGGPDDAHPVADDAKVGDAGADPVAVRDATDEDDPVADLLGVRATTPYGPRWKPEGRRMNEAILAYSRGRLAEAEAVLSDVEKTTYADDVDAEGLDLRARVLVNRASIVIDRGDLPGALRLFSACLATCDDAEHGDGGALRDVAGIRAGALINRSQVLQLLGRPAEALRDLDDALAMSESTAGGNATVLRFHIHNSRGCTLTDLERWEEAEADLRRALELAQAEEPRLAGHAHANLAMIANRTGDRDGATEHLRLARELHGLSGNTTAHALTDENLARAALDAGRLGEADRRFAAAQRVYEKHGLVLRAAGCRFGRASAALRGQRILAANRLLSKASKELAAAGEIPSLIECHLLQGDIASSTMRFAAGENAYLAARELCVRSGAMHEAARVDVRRAMVAFVSTKVTFRRRERTRRLEAALDLALPAALATHAVRHRFDVGPVRERWARTVSTPAMNFTFDLVARLGRTRLAFELVEYASATAVLESAAEAVVPMGDRGADLAPAVALAREAMMEAAGGVAPFGLPGLGGPAELVAPAGPPAGPGEDRAMAAGGLDARSPAPEFPPVRPALPPRLRTMPSDDSVVDSWIAAAEQHYGFPVRSDEVIQAW